MHASTFPASIISRSIYLTIDFSPRRRPYLPPSCMNEPPSDVTTRRIDDERSSPPPPPPCGPTRASWQFVSERGREGSAHFQLRRLSAEESKCGGRGPIVLDYQAFPSVHLAFLLLSQRNALTAYSESVLKCFMAILYLSFKPSCMH